MNASIPSGCSFGQAMVNESPVFDRKGKRKWSSNQAMGKSGVIRRDKRKKVKYL